MPVVMSSKQQQDKDKRESEIEFDRVQIVDELHYLDKQIEKKAGDNGILQHSSIGPMFRNDLCCWNRGGVSCTYFPKYYVDTTGRGRATFTGGLYFTIDHLEVWNILV